MRIKIYRRSIISNNLSIFLVLSFLFLHVLNSLNNGVSAFNLDNLLNLIIDNFYLVIVLLLTLMTTRSVGHISKYFLGLYFCLCIMISISIFIGSFDKIILIFSFIYILLSFFFYIFWNIELKEVIYTPGFTSNDVWNKSHYNFKLVLETKKGRRYIGNLTNWNESSCFIVLNEKLSQFKGIVKLEVEFEGRIFSQYGIIVSSYENGVGIKFFEKKFNSTKHNWSEFYTIIRDRGYVSLN